jgi:hypothetical protein
VVDRLDAEEGSEVEAVPVCLKKWSVFEMRVWVAEGRSES